MLESYIRTGDGKDYVDVDCVREALGIKEDEDIFLAIKELREDKDLLEELHANHINMLKDYAELGLELGIGSGDAESIKDWLGVLESVDYQNAKAARAELAHLYKTVLGKDRLDTNLSPHEVMQAILDEYKRRKEFLRELSCSLGFGDPVVTPDNIDQKEKDILERIEGLKAGVWPCENSSTFAEYLKKEFPELCKEYNVAPLTEGGSVRDWIKYIFENLADYRELTNINFRKAEEFRKEKQALTNSLAELRAKVREIYRSVVDDEWDDSLSYTSALNDINEEYKRVVHNFEERTADWSKAQQEYSRYRLAVGSLLDIPKGAMGDINAIERSFAFSKKSYESLKEFRDNVCEIFDIPSNMTDNYILKEIHDIVDRYDELEDFRADVCGALDIEGMLGTPKQNDKYILEQVEKLKETADRLARLRSNICTALCLGNESCDGNIIGRIHMLHDCHDKLCKDYTDLRQNLMKFRKNAIEDLKNRGFFFRPEEDEDLPEIFVKLLKRYDDYFSRYKEQYRLRQQWHVRWESENDRANGVQKALDREREKCRVKDISLETAKKQYEKVCNNLETAECALNGMRNKVRELQKEKTKVISALGQDIWDDCLK